MVILRLGAPHGYEDHLIPALEVLLGVLAIMSYTLTNPHIERILKSQSELGGRCNRDDYLCGGRLLQRLKIRTQKTTYPIFFQKQ